MKKAFVFVAVLIGLSGCEHQCDCTEATKSKLIDGYTIDTLKWRNNQKDTEISYLKHQLNETNRLLARADNNQRSLLETIREINSTIGQHNTDSAVREKRKSY